MTGIVIIREPSICLQINRARLLWVTLPPARTDPIGAALGPSGHELRWKHGGDHEWTAFQVDVVKKDGDQIDHAAVARRMYESIVSTDENVIWSWLDDMGKWDVHYSPLRSNARDFGEIPEELVGFGSLGR